MSDKTKIPGLWWLPDSPNERWTGTLAVGPDLAPKLKLIIPKPFWTIGQAAPKVIHGHDTGGVPITILFPSMPMGTSGAAVSQPVFTAGYAIHGMELSEADQFVANSFTVKMQHFHEWSGLTGFQRAGSNSDGGFSINYNHPDQITFCINDDLSIEFGLFFSMKNGFKKRWMEEEGCFVFKSKLGLSLKRYLQLVQAMRALLHFACLDQIYPISTTARKDGLGNTVGDQFVPQDIQIYSSNNRSESKCKSSRHWLFKFSDLESRFAKFFGDWLDFVVKFHEPLGCYQGTVYHRFPSEIENLCLAQAMEAYHGIKYGKQTFINRIHFLTSQYMPHLNGLIPDAMEFAKSVRDNRNYFTHHDPETKKGGRVVSGAALIRLNEKMRLILQICFLSEIGIPSDRFVHLRWRLAGEIIEYLPSK